MPAKEWLCIRRSDWRRGSDDLLARGSVRWERDSRQWSAQYQQNVTSIVHSRSSFVAPQSNGDAVFWGTVAGIHSIVA
jgi:hypothetical protein